MDGSVFDIKEVPSGNLHGGTEENDEDLRTSRDSNHISPEYKSFYIYP